MVAIVACRQTPVDPLQSTTTFWLQQVDSLESSAIVLADKIEHGEKAAVVQQAFQAARVPFKKMEALVGFYFDDMNESLNGPALVKTEEYDDRKLIPSGFQVIEESVFGETEDSTALLNEAKRLVALTKHLRELVQNRELSDAMLFEALRLEILTIMSMGISGFDSPVAFQSIPEAVNALKGVETILSFYEDRDTTNSFHTLQEKFTKAYTYLQQNPDFDSFDRAAFITGHLNPLSTGIYAYQQALKIPDNPWLSAWKRDSKTFFDKDLFNADFFAPSSNRDLKPEVAALGKVLFFDPVLSGNNSRACASCHQPGKAFSDGRAKSQAFNLEGEIARNAPTLINSGFQQAQFWDERVHFIEDQVMDVIANEKEMHSHISQSADKIALSDEYVRLFNNAFGGEHAVTDRNIQTALASYIRSLQGMNARFDLYMRGDKTQMTEQEILGFNLFMGKARCGTCHFMPLFNGTVPPRFQDTEAEVLGVPARPDTAHAAVDADLGKYHAYRRDLHKHAFKTASVRNAALTAPYMHNGVYNTLQEVIDFYNRGGGEGIGAVTGNQTLPTDKLNLSMQEQQQIIAFIQTLTDTTGMTTVPGQLPEFKNAAMRNRKVGGTY